MKKPRDMDIRCIFDNVVTIVFAAILIAIIISLIMGVGKLSFTILDTFTSAGITGNYLNLITDVLTLFVLVELSKSLVDYFHQSRLRMTFIVDAGIVFMIRELMILVFQHKADPNEIYSLSALLLVLTILRIGSIIVFQRESRMVRLTEIKD